MGDITVNAFASSVNSASISQRGTQAAQQGGDFASTYEQALRTREDKAQARPQQPVRNKPVESQDDGTTAVNPLAAQAQPVQQTNPELKEAAADAVNEVAADAVAVDKEVTHSRSTQEAGAPDNSQAAEPLVKPGNTLDIFEQIKSIVELDPQLENESSKTILADVIALMEAEPSLLEEFVAWTQGEALPEDALRSVLEYIAGADALEPQAQAPAAEQTAPLQNQIPATQGEDAAQTAPSSAPETPDSMTAAASDGTAADIALLQYRSSVSRAAVQVADTQAQQPEPVETVQAAGDADDAQTPELKAVGVAQTEQDQPAQESDVESDADALAYAGKAQPRETEGRVSERSAHGREDFEAAVQQASAGGADTQSANVTPFTPVSTAAQQPQVLTEATAAQQPQAQYANQVFADVVESVRNALMGGQKQLEIQLNPEFLGKMSIILTAGVDGITAKIHAGSDLVRDMLAANLQDLTGALKSQGIDMKNIEVQNGAPQQDFTGFAHNDTLRQGFADTSGAQQRRQRRISRIEGAMRQNAYASVGYEAAGMMTGTTRGQYDITALSGTVEFMA